TRVPSRPMQWDLAVVEERMTRSFIYSRIGNTAYASAAAASCSVILPLTMLPIVGFWPSARSALIPYFILGELIGIIRAYRIKAMFEENSIAVYNYFGTHRVPADHVKAIVSSRAT